MIMTGRVLSVETRNLGEPAVVAALTGATVISVADAATFDELGGQVTIGGAVLPYVGIDVDADTITLATGLATDVAEQDLVEVYPQQPVKTALVSLGDDGDPTPATVPHALLDRLPDGTRDESAGESVTLEQRGIYDFVVSDVVGEPLEQQSLDYVEGELGYGLSGTGVQMQDAQVTGEFGAAVVSADQIVLNGVDLAATLEPIPRSTKYATKGEIGNINAGTTNSTTELRMFTFDAGPVVAGRLYEVGARGVGNGTTGDVFWLRIRHTTDGSEPTLSSPTMTGGLDPVDVKGGSRARINTMTFFRPMVDGNLKIAVTAQRLSGAGTFQIFTNGSDFEFQVWATDLGINTDSTTALQQTAKVDGSGSDNPPVTTKTQRWYSTRVDCYSGTTGTSLPLYSNESEAVQGWFRESFGDPSGWPGSDPDFSVLSFNYSDIVSRLSTSSEILSCKLTFKVKDRWVTSGLDVAIFSHKYTTMPQTLNDWTTEVASTNIVLGAGSRVDCAPGSTYTVELGATMGGLLKTGARRGFGFYAVNFADAGRGHLFAYPRYDRPYLDITYKSP